MEEYKKMAEENLIELQEQKQKADKNLLNIEWYMLAVNIPVYLVIIFIADILAEDGNTSLYIVLLVAGIIGIFGAAFIGVKIEYDAGYYECPNCGERYVPTMSVVVWAPHIGRRRKIKCPCGERYVPTMSVVVWDPHIGRRRKMKCPYCNEKGYHKKVLTRSKQ
ncbi:MAG: hypothetical protein K6A23_12855 [Butyrivibrio sp.]|nr:hypothetical protein [Butyrivibrio sp.]